MIQTKNIHHDNITDTHSLTQKLTEVDYQAYSARVELAGKRILDLLRSYSQTNLCSSSLWQSKRTDVSVKDFLSGQILGSGVRRQYILFDFPVCCVDLGITPQLREADCIRLYMNGLNTYDVKQAIEESLFSCKIALPDSKKILYCSAPELQQIVRTQPMYIVK
jgi:hypothetical protein